MNPFRRRRKPAVDGSAVEIRKAGPPDLEAIMGLLAQLVAERIPRRERPRYLESVRREQASMLDDAEAAWFVAFRGSRPVGCARVNLRRAHPLLAYLEQDDYGYVFGLFVEPAEREHGLGRELLAHCESWTRRMGGTYCFLHAVPEAIPFYETLGFEGCLELGKKL